MPEGAGEGKVPIRAARRLPAQITAYAKPRIPGRALQRKSNDAVAYCGGTNFNGGANYNLNRRGLPGDSAPAPKQR